MKLVEAFSMLHNENENHDSALSSVPWMLLNYSHFALVEQHFQCPWTRKRARAWAEAIHIYRANKELQYLLVAWWIALEMCLLWQHWVGRLNACRQVKKFINPRILFGFFHDGDCGTHPRICVAIQTDRTDRNNVFSLMNLINNNCVRKLIIFGYKELFFRTCRSIQFSRWT